MNQLLKVKNMKIKIRRFCSVNDRKAQQKDYKRFTIRKQRIFKALLFWPAVVIKAWRMKILKTTDIFIYRWLPIFLVMLFLRIFWCLTHYIFLLFTNYEPSMQAKQVKWFLSPPEQLNNDNNDNSNVQENIKKM